MPKKTPPTLPQRRPFLLDIASDFGFETGLVISVLSGRVMLKWFKT